MLEVAVEPRDAQHTDREGEEAVELFDIHIRRPMRDLVLPDDEKAARLVDAFRTLLPAVTGLVEHHFRRVLLEVAQEHLEAVGEPAELAAAQAEPDWDGNETESRASEPDREAVS